MTPKEFVKTWFSLIDEQKFDEVKDLMHENHLFQNPLSPTPADKAGHLGMIQMMTNSFDGKHYIDKLVEENGCVAAYGRWSGKHVGEFQGIQGTGKSVNFTWADFFEIEKGKLVNEYFEMNPMSILAQISTLENQNA